MFVAVARLVDPDGAGRVPLLIVGGRPNSRGVVCSASYEARAFGVRSAMPLSRAARLCPNATFVPVPRAACGRKSREVRAVLERWAPVVEAASIDEFYLDLSGTEALYRGETLARTATRIREAVREETGLTVSIGGGTNRLVAKLAAQRAKPRPGPGAETGRRPAEGVGVVVIPPGGEAAFLAQHALADLPGVGPRLQATLRRRGLVSVADALAIGRATLQGWLGERGGAWLFDRIRGRAGETVSAGRGPQSISREETFPEDLGRDDQLETELLRLATRLAADLRSAGLRARCIHVKLRDHDFRTRQASRTLAESIDSDRAAFAVARDLLRSLRARRRVPARLIGVGFSRFEPAPRADQLELLGSSERASVESTRDRAVARAIDRVAARFGRAALEPARLKARQGRPEPPVT
jgi:DNA polymerase-4